MKRIIIIFFILFFVCLRSIPATAEDTIAVASFNIQVFGVTKASKPEVMAVLAQIISNFDIIAIQEIRDASGTAILDLCDVVNSLGSNYEVVVGPRLGRTTSKEQYAYMYRTSKISFLDAYTYDDSLADIFHREPYIASFSSKDGNFDFLLVEIHTDPDFANEEINSLPLVIEDAKTHFPGEHDIIVLGDLNADCSYFDEEDTSCLLRDPSYLWLISNDMDTNVATSSCTYDRIIVTADSESEFTGLAGVYRFDEVFILTNDEAKAVSDHYPVWAKFSIFDQYEDNIPGDIDSDGNITLMDVIMTLKVINDLAPITGNINTDINGDGAIGIEETIFILRHLSGLL